MKLNSIINKVLAALTFCLLLSSTKTIAQTYNDGCMNIKMTVGYSWVESVDDPLFGELNANEFRFRWWWEITT